MAYTTALLPVQSFYPALTHGDAGLVERSHSPGRGKGEAMFLVYTPSPLEGTYGRNGKEVYASKPSEFVDIFV